MGDAVPAVGHHRELVVGLRVPADRGVDGALERVGVALDQRVVGLVDRAVAEGVLEHASRRARTCRSPSRPRCRRRGAARCPAARRRRWWRSGSRRRRGGRPRSGRTSPGEGCTATPTGLSITTIESSSWMILMPSTISGTHLQRVGQSTGIVTSSIAPGQHPVALADGGAVDLRRARRRSGRRRGCGRARTSAPSRRRPARPPGPRAPSATRWSAAGHALRRSSAVAPVAARAVDADAAEGLHEDQHGGDVDAHVGDVEDRPVRQLRKSTTWPRSGPGSRNSRSVRLPATPASSRPRATAQTRAADPAARGRARRSTATIATQLKHDGVPGAGAERRARVAGQVQDQQVADQRRRPARRSGARRRAPW